MTTEMMLQYSELLTYVCPSLSLRQDMVGKTALYFATVCDRPFIVRELLDASANMELILAPKNLTACQTAAAINSAQ